MKFPRIIAQLQITLLANTPKRIYSYKRILRIIHTIHSVSCMYLHIITDTLHTWFRRTARHGITLTTHKSQPNLTKAAENQFALLVSGIFPRAEILLSRDAIEFFAGPLICAFNIKFVICNCDISASSRRQKKPRKNSHKRSNTLPV